MEKASAREFARTAQKTDEDEGRRRGGSRQGMEKASGGSSLAPPKKQTRTTRHLSWSVNIFHDFIHTFIHSFGGCVRR